MMIYSVSVDTVQGAVNSDKLVAELATAACLSGVPIIQVVGDSIHILNDLGDGHNKSYVDAVVGAHIAVSLDDKKVAKKKAIDVKTQSIIRQGFDFDGNHFSLSPNAQLNWIGIVVMQSAITWPLSITTDTDGDYDLAHGNLPYFVGTAMTMVGNYLASGRALKVACNAATTQAELDAVVDDR